MRMGGNGKNRGEGLTDSSHGIRKREDECADSREEETGGSEMKYYPICEGSRIEVKS